MHAIFPENAVTCKGGENARTPCADGTPSVAIVPDTGEECHDPVKAVQENARERPLLADCVEKLENLGAMKIWEM